MSPFDIGRIFQKRDKAPPKSLMSIRYRLNRGRCTGLVGNIGSAKMTIFTANKIGAETWGAELGLVAVGTAGNGDPHVVVAAWKRGAKRGVGGRGVSLRTEAQLSWQAFLRGPNDRIVRLVAVGQARSA